MLTFDIRLLLLWLLWLLWLLLLLMLLLFLRLLLQCVLVCLQFGYNS